MNTQYIKISVLANVNIFQKNYDDACYHYARWPSSRTCCGTKLHPTYPKQ